MISKYKKDYEKTVMGYLSYLPDFKNIKNLQEEMKLYTSTHEGVYIVDGRCHRRGACSQH